MKATIIEFSNGKDLTSAIKWVSDPDTQLAEASALRHVLYRQLSSDEGELIAFAKHDTWLYRRVKAQGIIGIEYLLDGSDVINRIGSQEVWLNNPIRMSRTKSNSSNLECLTLTGQVLGNALISNYNGLTEEFEQPESEWFRVGTVTGNVKEYTALCSRVNAFSGLSSDTTAKAIWFKLENSTLSLMATEKGGNRGNSISFCKLRCFVDQAIEFGLTGKYLMRTATLWAASEYITIEVNDREEPTRVRFRGERGYVDTPIIEGYHCQALSQGAISIFFDDPNYIKVAKAARVFNGKELLNAVAIQIPKKTDTTTDLVLEVENEVLVISKRSDIRRKEQSVLAIASAEMLSNSVEWQPMTASYNYLDLAVRYALSNCVEDANAVTDEDFMLDEEIAAAELSTTRGLLLTQQYVERYNRWLLTIEPTESDIAKVVLMVSTKKATNDRNEAD